MKCQIAYTPRVAATTNSDVCLLYSVFGKDYVISHTNLVWKLLF